MKKYLASISMVVLFALYLVYQRLGSLPVQPLQPITLATPSPSTNSSTVAATSASSDSSGSEPARGPLNDGTYVGSPENAFYGTIQVQAVISNGYLTDVQFLQYPNDQRESVEINERALPVLRTEAISAQSANVDAVSGASDSSPAFNQSLASALTQAE